MLRLWESGSRWPSVAVRLALILLLPALLLNTGAIYLIVRDQQLLGLRTMPTRAMPTPVILTLEREFNARIASRLFVSAILIVSAMGILATRKALRRVRLLAEDVFARTDKGLIAVDRGGLVAMINPAASRILQLDPAPVGRRLAELSTPGLPLAELVAGLDRGGPRERDVQVVVERDGGPRRIHVDVHALGDPGKDSLGSLILLSDVTRRHLTEQRVRRMERHQALEPLASGLLHEIQNPLAALSLHVQLLEERLGEPGGASAAAELLAVVGEELHRLGGILEQFREYASLQDLEPRPTDVVELLEDVARLIRPQAEAQGVRVVLIRPAPPMPPAALDAEKVKQAVLNLAINGLEAMPDGGELSLGAAPREGSVEVRVSDTGPGIAPEVRPDLFKPYVTTKRRGTGLGLALTGKLVGQHHGQIDYRTGPSGTSFVITLPIGPTEGHQP